MPDDYSKLVPPLPIPNRTVKRLCADDSAATSVKVGHRQAFIKKPLNVIVEGFLLCEITCVPDLVKKFLSKNHATKFLWHIKCVICPLRLFFYRFSPFEQPFLSVPLYLRA